MILVVVATLRLATHPRLSPRARMLQLHNNGSEAGSAEQPVRPVIAKSPLPESDAGQRDGAPIRSETIDVNTPSTKTTDDLETEQDATFDSTIYEQAEKIKTQKFHIVRKGETLSEISYTYYRSARQWPKILEANRKTIRDPKKLAPGTKIIIPD